MSKWTPGPWVAVIPSGPHIYCGHDIANFSIHSTVSYHDAAKVDNKTPVSGQFMAKIGHEESAANARLIAAAPEMAEVLEAVTKRMEWDYTEGPCAEQSIGAALPPELYAARAILARINGESQ